MPSAANSKPNLNDSYPKTCTWLWLAIMLAAAILCWRVLRGEWLETGFLALLPATEQKPDVAEAIKRHNALRDRKVIWLAGTKTSDNAVAQALKLKQLIHASGLLVENAGVSSGQMGVRFRSLFPYRYQLLDTRTQSLLKNQPEALLQENLATLYGPVGQTASATLESDPLLLLSRYIASQTPGKLSLQQGVPVFYDKGQYWALVVSELKDSDLQLDKLESLTALAKKAQAQVQRSGAQLLITGMPLFTAVGADAAKREISMIGLASSIGVVLLMTLAFRSIRPLMLSFIAISSGLGAALAVSVLVFGKIHIITLVFGASLIGVADDYALHFFCDGIGVKNWRPLRALAYLFPGLLTGLLTSLLSYGGLMLSPFPGLQQVALFSGVGLLTAWLTVVLLFPVLLGGFRLDYQPLILKIADYWQQKWPMWLFCNRRWFIPLFAAFLFGGLVRLAPSDDVRRLQSASAELTAAADSIRQLLPVSQDNQFFLVAGKNLADWQRNEESLLNRLEVLKQQGKLAGYQGISAYWPEQSLQKQNYRMLAGSLYNTGLVKNYMAGLGFSGEAIGNELKQFQSAKDLSIPLTDWLPAAGEGMRNLWLGCDAKQCKSRVVLSGTVDRAALAVLDNTPGVSWIDQVEELSSLFARYRVRAGLLLASANLLVFLGLGSKFGWRNALSILAVPFFAALSSLAMSGWFNQLFGLFNIFALLLVLGIGVDDAIFFFMASRNGHSKTEGSSYFVGKRDTTAMAVILSALTTILAFGMLAASATEVVHAFGFTVAAGITSAMLFSPLVGFKKLKRI